MTAAKAMALLKGKFNGSLTIVGGGDKDYVEQLKGFVQKENLPVHFTNASSPDEMPKIYQEHDALLFTSEWPEPFAITPLEAMACGLPVIGTTTGGSAELFREGINALTYRAADAEELSEKITQLELDNELRESIATTGQQEVRTRLAEPIIAAQIESYLQETLRSWSRPGARRFHGEAVYN
jgi:glycosyltransferase involved in cell wall biosynthesis